MRKLQTAIVIVISAYVVLVACEAPIEENHIYGTWDNMEIDKCASAWLIKSFVDSMATFKFYPSSELVIGAIPFDTPEAELRRTGTLSTFKNIIIKYNINEPCLEKLADVIQELEIKSWEKLNSQRTKDAIIVDSLISEVIKNSRTPDDCFEMSFQVFDSLFNSYRGLNH